MNSLESVIKKFKGQPIGVIGDIMVDHYIVGDVERISQEAPTPIVRVREDRFTPGGAANAAANIAALGGKPVMVGVVGKDAAGTRLWEILRKQGVDVSGIIEHRTKPTIEKIRVLSTGHQMLRLDREDGAYIPKSIEAKLIRFVEKKIPDWSAVVISDYTKGLVTEHLANQVVGLAKKLGKPIIVDTKPKHFRFFKGVTVMTPNVREAGEMSKLLIASPREVAHAGKTLARRARANILITQGADGMTLCGDQRFIHFPSAAREVFDVTGAGDTVVAALALAIASGAGLRSAALLANHAGGIVVGKAGTATVSADELAAKIHAREN